VSDIQARITEALGRGDQAWAALYELVLTERVRMTTKAALYEEFQRARAQVDGEPAEDLLLDMMDLLSDWTRPEV
jgi:hypothetical protein